MATMMMTKKKRKKRLKTAIKAMLSRKRKKKRKRTKSSRRAPCVHTSSFRYPSSKFMETPTQEFDRWKCSVTAPHENNQDLIGARTAMAQGHRRYDVPYF